MSHAETVRVPVSGLLRLVLTVLDRERAVQWVAEHGAALRPWARRACVKYLAPSSPARIREIYGVNYPRLARIKAQYDPANLFRSNQNVVPTGAPGG